MPARPPAEQKQADEAMAQLVEANARYEQVLRDLEEEKETSAGLEVRPGCITYASMHCQCVASRVWKTPEAVVSVRAGPHARCMHAGRLAGRHTCARPVAPLPASLPACAGAPAQQTTGCPAGHAACSQCHLVPLTVPGH